ncbi:hypothetical protein NHX12_008643 [Muraenolepis orangiensis]|uniref:Uncharacterized protein n=1 Tax=Muraenolepis orangiensis TaxID=630683 RepID=A0A9Q0I9I9_9TELE|nr:hypothetical protein NHX12_008643 [Muraenolepis orangiensis]
MPSLRQSYTVTEEPPAAFLLLKQEMRRRTTMSGSVLLKQEMRRRTTMSGSVLVSTFVGLLINQAKVGVEETSPRFPLPEAVRLERGFLHSFTSSIEVRPMAAFSWILKSLKTSRPSWY